MKNTFNFSVFSLVIFFLMNTFIFYSNASAQCKIPNYDQARHFAKSWCKTYFDKCFSGRSYEDLLITYIIDMHDDNGDYSFLQGKLHYTNYLGLPQSVLFEMKIYAYKTVFYKQTLSPSSGKLEWEICSKTRKCN